MVRLFDLPLEPLHEGAFAPFGQVVAARQDPPVFEGPQLRSWGMDFAADGPVELMFTRYVHQPLEFSVAERHHHVTQSFLPLGGHASVMVVAAPTGAEVLPEPGGFRAFFVPGDRGIMLWRGTWHATTRFPVTPPFADFAFITDSRTQRELEREKRDGTTPRRTETVDYADRFGTRFRIVDPQGLLPAA